MFMHGKHDLTVFKHKQTFVFIDQLKHFPKKSRKKIDFRSRKPPQNVSLLKAGLKFTLANESREWRLGKKLKIFCKVALKLIIN